MLKRGEDDCRITLRNIVRSGCADMEEKDALGQQRTNINIEVIPVVLTASVRLNFH